MFNKPKHTAILLFALLGAILGYKYLPSGVKINQNTINIAENITIEKPLVFPKKIHIPRDVRIGGYFEFLDSIVTIYDPLVSYSLTEHLLVRANPWIIDTLVNTDYYHMMARDSFVYDQKKLVVLQKGTSITIPDSLKAETIIRDMFTTTIDVNIPEFKLRIFQENRKLFEFPVRVGQNGMQFLEATGRLTDLRTKAGVGLIVAHHKNPVFYNPVNNERYKFTKRDDGKITLMPRIPSLETEINGVRNGQLIHTTTNPNTLGKAYSNGCIGTKEGDTWIIYYYAPVGTAINIRYALDVPETHEDQRILNDIYERIPGSKT